MSPDSSALAGRRRSSLFVPVTNSRFIARAATVEADCVVLDLEDSIPADLKATARAAVRTAAAELESSTTVAVRVNSGEHLAADLERCVHAGIAEVVLPKVESPDEVESFWALCSQLDYRPRLTALVESARGLMALGRILAVGDISYVALGIEDLRGELDLCAPTDDSSETLLHAHARVILEAVAAGVIPLGNLGTIAAFNDEVAVKSWADQAWQMGYRGGFCIHPKQVAIFNEAYRPSDSDREWAREVIAGRDEAAAQGRAVFLVAGRMIDVPLIRRAERILAQ